MNSKELLNKLVSMGREEGIAFLIEFGKTEEGLKLAVEIFNNTSIPKEVRFGIRYFADDEFAAKVNANVLQILNKE